MNVAHGADGDAREGEREDAGSAPGPAARVEVTVAAAEPFAVRNRHAGALPAAAGGSDGGMVRLGLQANRALAEAGWRLRRVGNAGLVGAALLVGAAVLFLFNNLPQASALAALRAQVTRLGPLAKAAPPAPGVGVGTAALPARDQAPAVLARIYAEAEAAGVELPHGQYEYVPARDGVAARYRMTFPVHASYPQLRAFMDRTLVALPAVAVEGLRMERKNVGDEAVDAELQLSAYVRSEP
jgi:hypothetical protein